MKRVAVLGGGIAGVVVANQLAQRGIGVDLYEKDTRLGGLHRTVEADGFLFDIGAFLYPPDHELFKNFPFLLPHCPRALPRFMALRPSGQVDHYPISLGGFIKGNGLWTLCRAAVDIAVARYRYRKRDSVPAYAKYYMGDTVYERTGLKRYIERLYQIPDSQVGIEFAEQRLSELQYHTPAHLVRRFFVEQQTARERKRVHDEGDHRPWVHVRHEDGFDAQYGAIGDYIRAQGVGVHLGASVQKVERDADNGFLLRVAGAGEPRRYERVVSTIPIPVMLRLIGETPRENLDHVHLLSLFYRGGLQTDAAFFYNFTESGQWKRITNFATLYPEQFKAHGEAWLTVEITTRDASEATLEGLRTDFEAHAARFGFLTGQPCFVGQQVTPFAYPVFHRGDSERVQSERERLTAWGIDSVGRQGRFEYLSSHQAALQARDLIELSD